MLLALDKASSHIVGSGAIHPITDGLRLQNGPTSTGIYSNAQIDDYHPLRRAAFLQRPPLTFTVHARFSHHANALRGTAGFGFWNDPFGMSGPRWPTLPRALWFFFSAPPSNMALALDVPGPGWKAATIDAWRLPFLLLAPTAPFAMPLMNLRPLYRRLWPIGQRAIGVQECMLDLDMTVWHQYTIVWQPNHVRFLVDDRVLLQTNATPRGPLGLVIWKDNQAMTVTPWGLPRHQLVNCDDEQWMEIARVSIQ